MEQTILTNVDTAKIDKLMNVTIENSEYFNSVVKKVVQSYSKDLDILMDKIRLGLSDDISFSDSEIEFKYMELSNLIYFMGSKLEQLSVYNSMSKIAAKEVYNKAYLTYQQKGVDGKNKTTVAETQAFAEGESVYESTVSDIYDHAYRIMKFKIDAANEMVSTLKHVLKKRLQDTYLSSLAANVKNNLDSNQVEF